MTTFYDFVSANLRSFYDRRIATPPVLDSDRYFPEHVVFTQNWRTIPVSYTHLTLPTIYSV